MPGPDGRPPGSDGARGLFGSLERLVGVVRLVHPFPSLLNAVATGAVALLAGGDPGVAGRLAASMLCLQASIGALNDVVDARLDAGQKPGKPIPGGLVGRRAALVLVAVADGLGLGLSAPSGMATLAVAGGGIALGYLYDVRLSRTSWSWLPLSLALPLLPIHAWVGATGAVPPGLITLVPAAVLAGAALAIANGLVDVERDALTGRRAVAVALGPTMAWSLHAGLLAVVSVLAVFVAPGVPAAGEGNAVGLAVGPSAGAALLGSEVLRFLRGVGVGLGVAALALGAAGLAAPRASIRERGWELEALGIAAIGLGWLAGTAATAGPGG